MSSGPLLITSLQNDQVKNLVKLRNRRERDAQGLTIIEEPLVISRALAAGYPLNAVYFCPEQLSDPAKFVLAQLRAKPDLKQVQLSAPVMAKVAYRDNPEGLLVVAPQVIHQLEDLNLAQKSSPALFVVLEGVEKPGNLGAVLRIADGAGADAVIICGQGTDLFNPNVLRASRGSFFTIPTVEAETGQILEYLHKQNIGTVGAAPAATDQYSDIDLTGPVAVVLGTEHEGLSDDLLFICEHQVAIPMLGGGDSLNVASSCAIILYEAVRQRRPSKG